MLRRFCALLLALALPLAFFGCARAAEEAAFTFTDSAGRIVRLPAAPKKTVALFGSFGEVWTLAGGTLAGVTDDVLAEGRFDAGDAQIVGSVKHPNLERVVALAPDFVILSADIPSHPSAARTLERAGIPCALFKTESFDDYLKLLKIFTEILGRPDLYTANGEIISGQIEQVKQRVALLAKPSVLYLRVYGYGAKAKADDSVAGGIVRGLGCKNIADEYPSLLQDLSAEIILARDPDFILAVPMGEDKAARETFTALLAQPAYSGLTAVKKGNAHLLDKNLFHYKPNARWGEAYACLEKILF